ncbi:MAG: bis-aminopropyl spermidine synthase family protein [Pseudolabrys sp.]
MVEQTILEKVAQATKLREGPAGVATVLRAVYRAGSLRLQDAARQARLPLPVTSAVRRELEKAGLLERKHGLSLTPEGRDFVERGLGLGKSADLACPACDGRGLVIPGDFQPVVEQLTAILARAPSADVKLDQAPCAPETAVLRALLMLQTGALEGKRVLMLGDDDSVSLAIGLVARALGRSDLTRRLTVLDVDARWLGFLREAGAGEGIAIETIEHDLRRPLPAGLAAGFDTVETDPPYTLEGARLFLTRAGEALAGDGQCFFSFAQWPAGQMLELQRVFTDLGFAVQAARPGFNRYPGATVLGNVGQLIELAYVKQGAAGAEAWSGPLYTADVNPRIRSYVCAHCGTRTVLGEDNAPDTIEALKAQGCRQCGAHTFRRESGTQGR